jgi:hypothetical protein
MLRPTAITLILLLSVGVMLPFANSAHGVRQSAEIGVHRNRHHSRAWWRRYRARLRRKHAAASAALAHRKALLGQPQSIPVGEAALASLPSFPNVTTTTTLGPAPEPPAPIAASTTTITTQSQTAHAVTTPVTTAAKYSDSKAPVKSVVRPLPGQMNVSVVALSRPNPAFLTTREQNRMLGGTDVADLRRIVIDKMVISGGWVTNDFVREVNGARVFVVTARTPRDVKSPEKEWTFYFTEADGRIYSLTTDAPAESAERMSNEADRFINKLHANSQPNNR